MLSLVFIVVMVRIEGEVCGGRAGGGGGGAVVPIPKTQNQKEVPFNHPKITQKTN